MIRICAWAASLAMVAVVVGAAVGFGFTFVPAAAASLENVPADPPPPLPDRTGVWPVNFTFYGNASTGWGFSNATIANPGPNITVYYGDTVNLTLVGNDPLAHSWFIDYDNSFAPNGNEPSSPPFNGPGNPAVLVWGFSALQPGNWTYRCGMHPNSMTGKIQVLQEPRPVNLTFYGDAGQGWGFSNSTIREPGPPLVVLWGTNVTLTLIGHDLTDHSWFIDYNDDQVVTPGEPVSPIFNSPVGKVIVWPFIADQTGNWTYRCGLHPFSMRGSVSIVGGPPAELPKGALPLITGIMVGALSVVLVFAVIYHVRAVRAAKRMR